MGGGNFISCPNQTLFLGDSLSVENQNGNVYYQWSPDSVLNSSTASNPYFTTDFNRHFKLKITDDSGCTDSTFIAVVMQPGYTQFTEGIYEDWENRYGGQDTAFKLIGEVYLTNHQTYVATTYQADSFTTKPILLVYDTLGGLKTNLLLNAENEFSYQVVDMQIDQRNGNVYLLAKTISTEAEYITVFKVVYYVEEETYVESWEKNFSTENNAIPFDLDLRAIDEGDSLHVGVVGKIWNTHSLFDRLTLIYTQSGSFLDSITSKNTSNDANFNLKFDNSNIYINGYETQNDTSNIVVEKLSYSSTITSSWATFYNYQSGNDYPTGIEFLGEDVYTSANVADTGRPSIMLLKHAKSNGNLQWAAKYNAGEELGDESNGLLTNEESIYIYGYTELEAENKDMVLLKYNTSGALQWGRTYEALGQQNDEILHAQLVNDTNIVCVGYGEGCGTEKDMQMLLIQNNGNIIWENRFDGLNYGEDIGQFIHLDTDLNGNNYLVYSGWAKGDYKYIATNRWSIYTPPEPEYNYNTPLHMLAVGLTDVANNPTVKNIITDTSHYYFDGIHYIYLQELLERAIALEIDVLDSMNTKIHAVYETGHSNDTVTSILNQLVFELDSGGWDTARVILRIPGYLIHKPNGFKNEFKLGYYDNKTNETPKILDDVNILDSYSSSYIDYIGQEKLIVNIDKKFHDFFPADFIDSDESGDLVKNNWMKTYYGCVPRKSNCVPCGTQPTADEISLGGTFLSNNGDWDIGVFFTHNLNVEGRRDNCYYNNSGNFREEFEGIVKGQLHNNINHYRRVNLSGISSHDAIIKTKKPMALYNEDINDLLFYDRYYACDNSIRGDFFQNNSLSIDDPLEGIKQVLYSAGGYYSIHRPKSFQKALNFGGAAFVGHFFSSNGPDMNMFYSNNLFASGCSSSNHEVVENYLIDNGSEFHATKNNVYPSFDDEILASSKLNVQHQFWAENKLIVGFSYAVNTETKNYAVFDDPNDCSLEKTGTLIAKFIQTPQNEIEIIKQVSTLYPNDELRIFVKVNFFSGSIYQCKTLTLDNTISIYEVINILPTGAINDYKSNIINYEVEVYKQ